MVPPAAGTKPDEAPLDDAGLAELFTRHSDHLRRMIRFRLDDRLAQRIDPSDVLQDAYLNARQRLGNIAAGLEVPPLVWLRQVTEQTIIGLHRRHLGAQQRAVGREISIERSGVGQTTSIRLASLLAGSAASPSQVAQREERRVLLEAALEQMDPIDREVLALRHFEELSNSEVADVLGLQATAASNRYIRALRRLKLVVTAMSDSLSE